MDLAETLLAYHERTKHRLDGYARSLGYLDWATQPDPFRLYEGAPVDELPLAADERPVTYDALQRSGSVPPAPLDRRSLAALLELSLGLSAWKELHGERWALRCNPSSGNLHPTEGYLLLPEGTGPGAGLWHYVSRDHALEQRAALHGPSAARLGASLPPGTFAAGLASIHWREAWKYGERAFRYCQHDAGHALAALRYSAASLGWAARLVEVDDAPLAALLGLDRPEQQTAVDPLDREEPELLLLVGPTPLDASRLGDLAASLEGAEWAGRANRLSAAHLRWEAVDVAAEASRRREGTPPALPPPAAFAERPPLADRAPEPFARLARRRRSAVGFDGATPLPLPSFAAILDALLPRPGVPPFDALPWEPLVHPVLFVHRVASLAPGLYALPRSEAGEALLRDSLSRRFAWTRADAVPARLPLFLLEEGDFQRAARSVSCHQAIASDGAFSLGMLAPLGETLRDRGPWWYRRLFWEAGAVGQALYLEAEAAGIRGTGIGCYFDDLFHDLLGIEGGGLQSLYHFTAGTPVDDPRLRSLPPYASMGVRR